MTEKLYLITEAQRATQLHVLHECFNTVSPETEPLIESAFTMLQSLPMVRDEPVAKIGMRDGIYKDSTPKLHVGDSAFEDWFQAAPFACQVGIKQISRDSYAAGMGDPLVTYATPQAMPPITADDVTDEMVDTLWQVGELTTKRDGAETVAKIVNAYLNVKP